MSGHPPGCTCDSCDGSGAHLNAICTKSERSLGTGQCITVELSIHHEQHPPVALPTSDEDDVIALFIQSPEEEPRVEFAYSRHRR